MKHTSHLIKSYRKRMIKRWIMIVLVIIMAASAVGYIAGRYGGEPSHPASVLRRVINPNQAQAPEIKTGKIIEQQPETSYSIEQTRALIYQTNKKFNLPVNSGITKQLLRFNSADGDNTDVPIYGRVYKPAAIDASKKLPIFAFAPGTTGIDDHCAASLEQPAKSNWANYDSLMAAYASQGYVVVTIDYEGMRDLDRAHHYMVGELEGRALLDSVRALKNLDNTKSIIAGDQIMLAGYSQGGHAAYWADKLSSSYAAELKVDGVVGFGPVSSVKETLADNTRGANINWFGPFVLASYSDYYQRDYDINSILLEKWTTNLAADISKNCIDTVIPYWGRNSRQVYQPKFWQALKDDTLVQSGFSLIDNDLERNTIGQAKTASVKLINQGAQDNVILPRQSKAFLDRLCAAGNDSVVYKSYTATHYNTMVASFDDTMSWMGQVLAGEKPASTCEK